MEKTGLSHILLLREILNSFPLLFTIEKSYTKFILAIKTLSVDRYSRFLQVFLGLFKT